MAENQPGNPDPNFNPDADVVIPEAPADGTPTKEYVEGLKTNLATAIAQKKHWRTEAIDPASGKKYKERTAPPPATPPTQTPPGDSELKKQVEHLTLAEEKRQFGHANQLSPEETDRAFDFARGRGVQPKDILSDPFFKGGLESFRATTRTQRGIPSPSHRAPTVEGKAFKDMTPDERSKNFPKVAEQFRR